MDQIRGPLRQLGALFGALAVIGVFAVVILLGDRADQRAARTAAIETVSGELVRLHHQVVYIRGQVDTLAIRTDRIERYLERDSAR